MHAACILRMKSLLMLDQLYERFLFIGLWILPSVMVDIACISFNLGFLHVKCWVFSFVGLVVLIGGLVHLWKITVELPRSQGSLPDKPEASKLHVFLSLWQTYIADVFPGYSYELTSQTHMCPPPQTEVTTDSTKWRNCFFFVFCPCCEQ